MIVDYDECIAIHEDYLLKQSAVRELEWEWLEEYPADECDWYIESTISFITRWVEV